MMLKDFKEDFFPCILLFYLPFILVKYWSKYHEGRDVTKHNFGVDRK